jgi:hypothetical protein
MDALNISVVDPDPVGSETFYQVGSGSEMSFDLKFVLNYIVP